jgi:Raf kinase inhibitor-like YbhB/YbcL family protein
VSTRTLAVCAALVTLVTIAAACDTGDGKTMRPPTAAQRAALPTTTTSTTVATSADGGLGGAVSTVLPGITGTAVAPSSFAMTLPWSDGGAIDGRFTCDGADVSPPITWTAPPAGTVELALLAVDDDAGGYVHWAVAGIPPTAGGTAEGATFAGAVEGENGFGKIGYGGPCPPTGATHTYRFTLYALDQQPELPAGFTGKDLENVTATASLAVAETVGTYTRAG